MNNQYINNSNDEEQRGFKKSGVLLLKNITDKIEYHLFNNKLPYPICTESYDINEEFRLYTYKEVKRPIHITISDKDGIIFAGTGELRRKVEHEIEKFYLDDYDLEMLLFNNTEKVITININIIKDVAIEEGDNENNESRENKS
jgi:hypothetical protein